MKKPVFSFRLDSDVIKKANESGIDVPRFIEIALMERLKLGKCPMCGQKTKAVKK